MENKALSYILATTSKKEIAFITIFIALIYTLALNLSGIMYSTTMFHDNLIFIDGIYRVKSGHIPHLDFTTGLGMLNFYGGYWFTYFFDTLSQAFIAYNTLILYITIAIAAYIGYTRLNRLSTIMLLLYCAAIVGTPCNIGEEGKLVTHAMFYNRFGWAFFSLGFLFLLKPNRKQYIFLESIILSFILLFLFYTKVTYFVALSSLFLLVLALYWEVFNKHLLSIAIFCTIILTAIEIKFPGIHFSYLRDLIQISNASDGIIDLQNALADSAIYLLTTITCLYIIKGIYNENTNYCYNRHIAIGAFYFLMSLFILSNNAQETGLPSISILFIALLSIFSAHLRNKYKNNINKALSLSEKNNVLILSTLLIAMTAPEIIERQGALERFARHGFKIAYEFKTPLTEKGLYTIEGDHYTLLKLINQKTNLDVQSYRQIRKNKQPRQEIFQTETAFIITDGYYLFKKVISEHGIGPIINLDFSNPFSFLLGTPPAVNDYAWYHTGRNISSTTYKDPRILFSSTKYISIPKFPVVAHTTDLLLKIYQPYIRENFYIIAEDSLWEIWMKKTK